MNMGYHSALEFLNHFKTLVSKKQEEGNFIFFPPLCLSALFQTEKFYWGGQNISHKSEGALTGETSAKTLKEMGANFCLLGHSERRYVFGESDADIEKKFQISQELALIPVLCIGENLKDRFDKEPALRRQVSWIKNYNKYQNLPWKAESLPSAFHKIPFIIAYEPLWAIGSGDLPSCEEIDEAARFIKEYLSYPFLKVFYGGSVSESTARNFSKCLSLDGLLVGGASLNPNQLYNIYQKIHSSTLQDE